MGDLFEYSPVGKSARKSQTLSNKSSTISSRAELRSTRCVQPYVSKQSVVTFHKAAPSVVIKVTSYQKNGAAIKALLDYISRDSDLALESGDGYQLRDDTDRKELVDDWMVDSKKHKNSRESMHLVLSAPPGTDKTCFLATSEQYLREQFGSNHEYVFVPHNDEKHPHVHAVIKTKGHDGLKLRTNKQVLQDWRSKFSEIAKDHGLEFRSNPAWMNKNIDGLSTSKDARYSKPTKPYQSPKGRPINHERQQVEGFRTAAIQSLEKRLNQMHKDGDLDRIENPTATKQAIATLIGVKPEKSKFTTKDRGIEL